jgi:hypothetical protein
VKRFELGQRVHVVRDQYANLIDKPGKVVRLRRGDHGAWIQLDERDELHCPFPADDDRGRNIMAYPEHCRPEHLAPVESAPELGSSLDSLPPGDVERIMAALRSALEGFDAERAASAAPHADGCGCNQCHLVSSARKLLAFHERRVKR